MIVWIGVLVVAFQVVLPGLFHLSRNRIVFQPSQGADPARQLRQFGGDVAAEVVHVTRPDGRRLAAYDARPKAPEGDDAPVVLYLHGNAGDLASRAGLVAGGVRSTGLRWLALDYSGYGTNPGAPSEREVERDALAAFDHLVAEGVAPGRIVVYGQSLGGAVAAYVATERPVGGLVLQSTFSSAADMARAMFPWMPLGAVFARDVFPTSRRVAGLTCPLVIVHGERDRIIPVAHAERLRAAAPPGTELIRLRGADHNDMFSVGGPELLARLAALFRDWTAGDGAR